MMKLMPSVGLWGKAFSFDAVSLNGTSDKIQRNGGLTGAASSKLFTLSMWLRIDGGDGAPFRNIFSSTPTDGSPDNDFALYMTSLNRFGLAGQNEASGGILGIVSNVAYTSGAAWRHFITSVDMASPGNSWMYVDDVDADGAGIVVNDTLDFVSADWVIGLQDDGTFGCPCSVAEVWFADGVFMNVSTESNRRKFRTADGRPAFLGRFGEGPTGTPPRVYLHLDAGEDTRNFVINRGTGGDFTSGALARASTKPGP